VVKGLPFRALQEPVGLICPPKNENAASFGESWPHVSPVAGGWGDDQGSRNIQVAHAVGGNLPVFDNLAVNRVV
jgi:hypothetical protein